MNEKYRIATWLDPDYNKYGLSVLFRDGTTFASWHLYLTVAEATRRGHQIGEAYPEEWLHDGR